LNLCILPHLDLKIFADRIEGQVGLRAPRHPLRVVSRIMDAGAPGLAGRMIAAARATGAQGVTLPHHPMQNTVYHGHPTRAR
jgi:hypothetical protein